MSVLGVIVTASPLMVRLDSGDAELPAKALASYAPTIGDRVLVDTGPPLVVLGSTGPGDTGWIYPTLAAGWSANPGEAPGWRRLNGVTYLRGRASTTGANAVAFVLPVGFRPLILHSWIADAYGVAVWAVVYVDGSVGQVQVAGATSFSFGSCPPFPAEA